MAQDTGPIRGTPPWDGTLGILNAVERSKRPGPWSPTPIPYQMAFTQSWISCWLSIKFSFHVCIWIVSFVLLDHIRQSWSKSFWPPLHCRISWNSNTPGFSPFEESQKRLAWACQTGHKKLCPKWWFSGKKFVFLVLAEPLHAQYTSLALAPLFKKVLKSLHANNFLDALASLEEAFHTH